MSTPTIQPKVDAELAGRLWVKYRRDVIATAVVLIALLLLVGGTYFYFLRMPQVDVETAARQDVISLIYSDSYWFHVLWVRWTAVDWILTFLATGTALSAVLKNSLSVKSDAAGELSKWDILLVVLAIFAVLGTTFDGKIHAGQLAEKYRAGDLILQEAKIDYAGSKKDQAATDALVKRWHEAQTILESTSMAGSMVRSAAAQAPAGPGAQAPAPQGNPAPAATGGQSAAPAANPHPAGSANSGATPNR